MLGRSKGKPGAARAKARDMAMAQRNKAPTTSGGSSGAKTVAKSPTPAQLEQVKGYESFVRQALNQPKVAGDVAAKPVQKPVAGSSPVYMPGGNKYTPNERPLNSPSLIGMPPNISRSPAYDAARTSAKQAAESMATGQQRPPMQAGGAGGLMNQAGPMGMKKGGAVKTFKKGGSVDGCAQRGKTKGRYI
jgi:hypothetical protein